MPININSISAGIPSLSENFSASTQSSIIKVIPNIIPVISSLPSVNHSEKGSCMSSMNLSSEIMQQPLFPFYLSFYNQILTVWQWENFTGVLQFLGTYPLRPCRFPQSRLSLLPVNPPQRPCSPLKGLRLFLCLCHRLCKKLLLIS